MSHEKTAARCPRCLLPSSFPGIKIGPERCNYCEKYEKKTRHYRGEAQLKADIAAILSKYPDRSAEYDAAVGYSGGMDSTWLLYYAAKVLNLRVLAITVRHRYMPPETMENIRRVARDLGVTVLYVDNPYLDENAAHFIRCWAKRPTARGLIGFCTGCRYGLTRLLPQAAAERRIHILLSGETQYERSSFKTDVVNLDPNAPSPAGMALGYGMELLRNPAYLAAPGRLAFQVKEYSGKKQRSEFLKAHGIARIRPFTDYIEWNRDEAQAVLDRLGWRKSGGAGEAWRSDCLVGLVRQHYYRRLLGFNDQEVKRAHLLRAGQLTLEAPGGINETDPALIRRIMQEAFGLDYDEIERRIERLEK